MSFPTKPKLALQLDPIMPLNWGRKMKKIPQNCIFSFQIMKLRSLRCEVSPINNFRCMGSCLDICLTDIMIKKFSKSHHNNTNTTISVDPLDWRKRATHRERYSVQEQNLRFSISWYLDFLFGCELYLKFRRWSSFEILILHWRVWLHVILRIKLNETITYIRNTGR